MARKPASVEAYIRSFPAPTQRLLRQLRAVIREAAPAAVEKISYGVPTVILEGNPLYFAAYRRHLGLYGGLSQMAALAPELARYETGKGTLRLPLDEPLPTGLIKKIVRLRAKHRTTSTRLELRDGPTGKFVEVSVAGTVVTVRWGRVGTSGRVNRVGHEGARRAAAAARRLVAEELDKGFTVVRRP